MQGGMRRRRREVQGAVRRARLHAWRSSHCRAATSRSTSGIRRRHTDSGGATTRRPCTTPITEHTGAAAGRLAVDVGCGTGFVTTSLDTAVERDRRRLLRAHAGGGARRRRRHAPPRARARRGASAARRRGVARHLRHLVPLARAAAGTRGVPPCARAGWLGGALLALRRARRAVDPAGGGGALASRRPDVARVRGIPRPPCRPVRGLGTRERAAAPAAHGALRSRWRSSTATCRRSSGSDASPGTNHAAFLDRLGEELSAHHPDGFEERNEEHLFLARRPA